MGRRQVKSDAEQIFAMFFDLFRVTPWWVGPPVAAIVFSLVSFLVPAFCSGLDEPLRNTFTSIAKMLAPVIAGAVLLLWLVALVVKLGDRRLLSTRSNPESVRSLTWQEFERLIGEAFRRQGYTVAQTQAGADGGVDLILTRSGERTFVQCKHWKSWKVGVKPVRELLGIVAAKRATRGIMVCDGQYTAEARRFVQGQPIELMDGPQLWAMIEDVRGREPGQVVSERSPASLQRSGMPACPQCSSPMVLRTASKGANAGSQFYGCSRFPACRGIRPCVGTPTPQRA